jgi:hypothetical protein
MLQAKRYVATDSGRQGLPGGGRQNEASSHRFFHRCREQQGTQ